MAGANLISLAPTPLCGVLRRSHSPARIPQRVLGRGGVVPNFQLLQTFGPGGRTSIILHIYPSVLQAQGGAGLCAVPGMGDSRGIGVGLCRILDVNFREFLFHALR
jgi:hypothetical protein